MVSSTNNLAFEEAFEVWNQAIDDPKGARIRFDTEGDAIHYRLKLHAARRADRESNEAIYERGDPLYGRSAYDGMVVRIRQNGEGWYVYIVRVNRGAVEPLSEVVEEPKEIKVAIA